MPVKKKVAKKYHKPVDIPAKKRKYVFKIRDSKIETMQDKKLKASTPKSSVVVATRMSDAEATIKFNLFEVVVDLIDRKDAKEFPQLVRDAVFKKLFEPQFQWAIEEHLATLK
jgi:hypothetical protein